MPVIHFIPTDKPEVKDNEYMLLLFYFVAFNLVVLFIKHQLEQEYYQQLVNLQTLYCQW